MQKLITLLLLLASSVINGQNCDAPPALRAMDTPRASFIHSTDGLLWSHADSTFTNINDPELSSAPTRITFGGGLWHAGIDPNGDLFLNGVGYLPHFSYGPITSDFPNEEICGLFNQIWEVSREDIEQAQNGALPENVKLWPGRGNQFILQEFGVALPDMPLAPFVDLNSNNKYEPDQGEVPAIKGANIAQWWINNDSKAISSGQLKYVSDFAVLAYSYDDNASPTTTYFYEYDITNRSQLNFEEMRLALWVDSDLGCYQDDYIGCKPDHNLAYAYNASATDGAGSNCNEETPTFDNGIPLFAIKVLDGTDRWDPDQGWVDNGMSSFNYFSNASVGNNPPETLDPSSKDEFWNYMNGKWRAGTPLTQGGTGYNPGSTDVAKYAFPDDPNDAAGWNMCSANVQPGDYRMLINSGPYTIPPGESMKFAFATIVTAAIPDYPCPSLAPLLEACEIAQEIYDSPLSSVQHYSKNEQLKIAPNPSANTVEISLTKERISSIQLYTANGTLINSKKGINQSTYQLTISQFPAGLYWLKVLSDTGDWTSQKIVKI